MKMTSLRGILNRTVDTDNSVVLNGQTYNITKVSPIRYTSDYKYILITGEQFDFPFEMVISAERNSERFFIRSMDTKGSTDMGEHLNSTMNRDLFELRVDFKL